MLSVKGLQMHHADVDKYFTNTTLVELCSSKVELDSYWCNKEV